MRFREITEAKNETRTKGKLKDGTPVTVFVKQEPEKVTTWIKAGNEFLGSAYFVKADFAGRPGKWVATSTFINTEWRRKGANSLMYDAVEKLGYDLIPEPRAGKLSQDGAAFWRARKIRKGRVNEETGGGISPEQARAILTDRRCKHGVKISPNAKLWRGVSEHSGHGMATYGLGLYFTANRKEAAAYGRVVEVPRSMLPNNPLRFDGVNDYQIWLQTAQRLLGYPSNREFVADYDDIGKFVRALDSTIDGIQLFSGKDAMFVAYGTDHIKEDAGQSAVPSAEEWDKALPLAGAVVSGLRVRNHIDNLGSIGASFEDYFTLKGIREVPFSLFSGPDGMTRRIEALMADIEENGEITPFIVAIDSHNGPYILEGAHRYDALQYLDKPTFPALVVFDNDDGYFGDTDT